MTNFFFLHKGAGRVAFSNQQSYIAAISARFVQLQHGDIDKRVEVKPYVLDDQMCDECQGQRCSGKFAPFFCANVTCLQVKYTLNVNRVNYHGRVTIRLLNSFHFINNSKENTVMKMSRPFTYMMSVFKGGWWCSD